VPPSSESEVQIEHIVVSLYGIYQLNMASQILLTTNMKFLDLTEVWNVSSNVGNGNGRSTLKAYKICKNNVSYNIQKTYECVCVIKIYSPVVERSARVNQDKMIYKGQNTGSGARSI
jgi:hypothetical protein